MEINPSVLMILSVVGTAIVSFLGTLYWTRRGERGRAHEAAIRDTADRERRITELERKLGEMSQTVQPLSAAFQAVLIKQLTHLHTPELDALLVKLGPPVTLTAEEEKRLAELLIIRTTDMHDEIDESEREAAMMLPFVIKRVKAEQDMDVAKADLHVVAIPPEELASKEKK